MQAIGAVFDVDDFGVVEEAAEDGGGRGYIAEEFAPFFDGAVGGHQRRTGFVAAHDDLEEVFAGARRELFDAHVVEDEEVGLEVASAGGVLSEKLDGGELAAERGAGLRFGLGSSIARLED